ncbi:MAG: hypothetical protein CM15mP44_9280 [Candidatus Neomarinimicrobiota bacterium]|nr:MAG: hypothetical protein CM15mP44_9280 [Candidatus Neomarinimicrobiota bacterium]
MHLMQQHVLGVERVWRHVKMLPASLFTSAKIAQLSYLPQGQPEREERVYWYGKQNG